MTFKIGEKVGFLYEKGGGSVVRFDAQQRVVVLDETGFERPFLLTELVKIHGNDYQLDAYAEDAILDDGSLSQANYYVRQELLTGRKRMSDVWEIDLHIEELVDSHIGMSNTQILMRQMSEFKTFFKKARSKNIGKLIIIHGVGEGVLKHEIHTFLAKKDGVEFFDAPYIDYGKGATEIRIHGQHND